MAAKQYSDEAANVYERAIGTVLNTSMLLRFAYADFEEGRMNYEKVHSIYKSYLENEITTDPTLVLTWNPLLYYLCNVLYTYAFYFFRRMYSI